MNNEQQYFHNHFYRAYINTSTYDQLSHTIIVPVVSIRENLVHPSKENPISYMGIITHPILSPIPSTTRTTRSWWGTMVSIAEMGPSPTRTTPLAICNRCYISCVHPSPILPLDWPFFLALLTTIVWWGLLRDESAFATRLNGALRYSSRWLLTPDFLIYIAWSNVSVHTLNSVLIMIEILISRMRLYWGYLPLSLVTLGLYLSLAYLAQYIHGQYRTHTLSVFPV